MRRPLLIHVAAGVLGAVALLVGSAAVGQIRVQPGKPVASSAQGRSLERFHQALEALRAGKTERVTVVQIGDSHTAGDVFSGRLRELLQEKFGNGGRGMMPPGYPFPYWRPTQVEVGQSGSWEVQSSNRADFEALPFGISGFIAQSRGRDDTMTLEANTDAEFDSVDIDFQRQPDGGSLIVSIDGKRVDEINTRGRPNELARRSISTHGSRSLELRTVGNGVVSIGDWAVYKKQRGLVLSSFGFSGAEIGIIDHWEVGNLTRQLRELAPALIILAFGTNEGFKPPSSLTGYHDSFRTRLAQLREILPDASIVVVGPPDADRLPDYCGIRGAQRETVGCRPLSAAEASDYSSMLARRDKRLCHWHPPAGLAVVREAQQRASSEAGAFFWDWSTVQGGACGANRWVPQKLQRQDRIHMFEVGYGRSAERLFGELLRDYHGR